jgi:hypothetical protein
MTETQDPKTKPEKLKKGTQIPLSEFEAKRAQNLRDNLMKRKQQARARADSDNTKA